MQQLSIAPWINPAIPSALPEYDRLLLPETRAYLEIKSDEDFSSKDPSIDEVREKYLKDCQKICPSGQFIVKREDQTILSHDTLIPLRQYIPNHLREDAQILFFHGGGFVVGNLDSHDEICARLSAESGLKVTAVDYHLAPEHPFPTAFEDCANAYIQLRKQNDMPIILCGDSAGGNLAAAVSVWCRDQSLPMPKAQILFYPYLGGDPRAGSYQYHRDAPALNLETMAYYGQCYFGDNRDFFNDPRALPLRSFTFAELPATYCQIAEIDPIADDGRLYCQFLQAAGVPAKLDQLDGVTHGYLRYWQHSAKVGEGWQKSLLALNNLVKDTL